MNASEADIRFLLARQGEKKVAESVWQPDEDNDRLRAGVCCSTRRRVSSKTRRFDTSTLMDYAQSFTPDNWQSDSFPVSSCGFGLRAGVKEVLNVPLFQQSSRSQSFPYNISRSKG
jgi:hypothetical protein